MATSPSSAWTADAPSPPRSKPRASVVVSRRAAALVIAGSLAVAAVSVLGTSDVHANGGDAVHGAGDEQRLAVPTREGVVGGAASRGNGEDVRAVRVEGHHAFAIADVHIAELVHRHAVATPVGELAHVPERAITLDVEHPGA